ncbi:hypothetical protein N7478_006538 [Penicillium angulare]|uniref:uncharacterized protein n=1 Tax=Penicillium angulare TaxID=116970 RepID=UPI0025422668|nr:uncharacterized protein N7478_006538 [Penicillium angulare]KAJ5281166.1 hypothetical protein N7478_006538 [Penicillium angulare]
MSMHTSLRRAAATLPSSTRSILPSSQIITAQSKSTSFTCSQCRHATLLRRPKRPYTFTQLVTLSDGSSFTHRTSSPTPVYRSTRDTRNSLLWNPTSSKLMNVEDDEAGRLAAFRARFGRSFDANAPAAEADATAKKEKEEEIKAQQAAEQEEEDNLLDLISSFGQQEAPPPEKKKKW